MSTRQINSDIARLLEGLGLEGEDNDFCDFTIADQNLVAESQGITPTTPSSFKPVLGANVTYVVACVIINESNEVLMMQEAKQHCAGKWYLPAGRMEKGESIVQAAAREVLEETGLECEPKTLLIVETAGGAWFRFVLTAEIVGGELKTPAKADKESLQAKWIDNMDEITLRANDIVHIIEKARLYKQKTQTSSPTSQMSQTSHMSQTSQRSQKSVSEWHKDILPAPTPHMKDLLRLIIVIKKRSTNKLHVLLCEKTSIHFPTCEINPAKNVHSTLRRFMVEMFGADVGQHRPMGLLNVEADPSMDGLCLTLLVAFRPPLEEVPLIGKCVWYELDTDVEEKLLSIIGNKNSTVDLHVVR